MTTCGILLIILVLYYGAVRLVNGLSGSKFLSLFSGMLGKELLMDDKQHTNILLLGVGGESHEGSNLTDTIIIASIDHTNKRVSLLSIPRDTYIESMLGKDKINSLYEQGKLKWNEEQGIDFARTTIERILATSIHYVIKVDFQAFEKIVDSVNGIDVYVSEAIHDPFYPKGETFEYETFTLPQGNQHLDGATALKYVRSRKTTSDFDRSKRQQQVLMALKNKAQTEDFFGKKRLIEQLYYSLSEHVATNMSIPEMLSLADFAANLDSGGLTMAAINDQPDQAGGFLYTPVRELYGGAFVLVPAGDNFDSIRKYIQFVFYGPETNKYLISVLNGTPSTGAAGRMSIILNRFGFSISEAANASSKDIQQTTWYVLSPEAKPLVDSLKELVPANISSEVPPVYLQRPELAGSKIILELGADSREIISKLDIFKNVIFYNVNTSGTTTGTTSATKK